MATRLMTAKEVAEYLGLRTPVTIYRWTESGRLPAVVLSKKALRYRREERGIRPAVPVSVGRASPRLRGRLPLT